MANKTRLGGTDSMVNIGASLPSTGQQQCHSWIQRREGPWRGTLETEAQRGEGTCWRAQS